MMEILAAIVFGLIFGVLAGMICMWAMFRDCIDAVYEERMRMAKERSARGELQ